MGAPVFMKLISRAPPSRLDETGASGLEGEAGEALRIALKDRRLEEPRRRNTRVGLPITDEDASQ